MTREQKDFLERTVSGLTEEGKIICVRLALFAEMRLPWSGRTYTPPVGSLPPVSVPPMVLSEAPTVSTMPLPALPQSRMPVASVPMRLPMI